MTSYSDVPLNSKGEEQARRAALALANVAISAVITSPASRARSTAEIVLRSLRGTTRLTQPEISVDERLRELEFGPFEGLTRHELSQRAILDSFDNWINGRLDDDPIGVEALQQAQWRAEALMADLIENAAYTGSTVLLVTHGHFSRIFLMSCVLGSSVKNHRRLRFDNCKFSDILLDKEGARLVSFNSDTVDPTDNL